MTSLDEEKMKKLLSALCKIAEAMDTYSYQLKEHVVKISIKLLEKILDLLSKVMFF